MIDITAFLRFVRRRLWVVALVTSGCLIITYFLVKNLPDQYVSEAQIVTGIADRTQQILGASTNDYYRVTQQFNSLSEMMRSKSVISKLSIRLILHDLQSPENAFRPLPEELAKLTAEQRDEVIQWYKQRLGNRKTLSLLDNGKYPFYDYLGMMGYDDENLLENLGTARRGETDIVNIRFKSESPVLSVFVVNALSDEFIGHYYLTVTQNESNTMALLDSMLLEKKRVMDEKNAMLRNYKSHSGVVNINAQAEALYQQIAEYETKRSQALSDVQSIGGAIAQINEKLKDANDTDVNSAVAADNNELLRIGREIEIASKRYVDNKFNAHDKQVVDSLERLRSGIVARISNKQLNNPQATRQNLIQERTTLEIELARAKNGISAIESDLASLKGRYYTMAPAEAGVQDLEREAELSVEEYTEALNRFNQANTENAGRLRLRVIQEGLPGLPEPSKKNLYLAGSGAASFAICVVALLVFFLLDNKITDSQQLQAKTGHRVLGGLSLVNEKSKDLRTIWETGEEITAYQIYKDLIRALRFEISKAMSENQWKVLGITSLSGSEGKTFVASSLAYAFALTGKKVLMIGDDCHDLTSLITNEDKVGANQFEKFLVKKEIKAEDLITVLKRNPDSTSLLELRDSKNLIDGFEVLRNTFDVILIDINSLKDTNRAKEWLMFTDCSLAVFKAGNSIEESDRGFMNYILELKGFMGWVINQVRI